MNGIFLSLKSLPKERDRPKKITTGQVIIILVATTWKRITWISTVRWQSALIKVKNQKSIYGISIDPPLTATMMRKMIDGTSIWIMVPKGLILWSSNISRSLNIEEIVITVRFMSFTIQRKKRKKLLRKINVFSCKQNLGITCWLKGRWMTTKWNSE